MDAYYENGLVLHCKDVVCPGDPFAIKDEGLSASARTSSVKAGEGGGYTGKDADLVSSEAFERGDSGPGGGAADAKNLRLYLGVGVGVVSVLALWKWLR